MDISKLLNTDIKSNAVWAMPTDTIYGLSCKALDKEAVDRLDSIKQRTPDKSYIIMIGDVSQLELFGIQPNERTNNFLARVWPGPVSVVLPGLGQKFSHLDGEIEGLAFRLPDDAQLREICMNHGPLVTTSANKSGQPSLLVSSEIQQQLGSEIDFIVTRDNYVPGSSSTVIKLLR